MENIPDLSSKQWVTGIKQTQRALEKGLLQKVYIAQDVESKVIEPLLALCKENNIPVEEVLDSMTLGKACKIAVKAAAAGILT
jgi:Ribosomal protein HS6-type (S12/L30/L7a)